MKQLIKRFEAFGTTEIQKDSGHPIRVTTLENKKVVKEMICSQEDPPGTHVPSKDIAKGLKTSQFSVRRMIKRKRIKQFKRLKMPYINDTTQKRRLECAGCLLEKFEINPIMIEREVFKDKRDFLLQLPLNSQNYRIYFKSRKNDVPDKILSHQTNRQSVKVMVSASLTWFGVTKPVFVDKK